MTFPVSLGNIIWISLLLACLVHLIKKMTKSVLVMKVVKTHQHAKFAFSLCYFQIMLEKQNLWHFTRSKLHLKWQKSTHREQTLVVARIYKHVKFKLIFHYVLHVMVKPPNLICFVKDKISWKLLNITHQGQSQNRSERDQGADSIKRCYLTSIGNPIVEIRRSYDGLISTMGFPILVRWHLYIESGPWIHLQAKF